MQEAQLWECYQLAGSRCLGSSAFLILDLTLHGQWHVLPLRCQTPHSSRFASFGSHPNLATSKGVTVEVEKTKGARIVLPSCACHLAHLSTDLYSKGTVQESQLWDLYQLAGSKMV